MRKYLRVQMPDGALYDIPAEIIAEHRAAFFENNSAEKLTYHASSVQPRLYRAEKEFALSNDEVLVEWATKKMKWSELERHAVKVKADGKTYDEEWSVAEKKIVSN